MPYHIAALAEPLACVLNGLGSAGLRNGTPMPRDALVIGAGPIGLLLALTLRAEGAETVTVADINESRLAFAAELGLGGIVSGSADLTSRARSYDFVADATGIAPVAVGMLGLGAQGRTAL